jgi:hypothetical protein
MNIKSGREAKGRNLNALFPHQVHTFTAGTFKTQAKQPEYEICIRKNNRRGH